MLGAVELPADLALTGKRPDLMSCGQKSLGDVFSRVAKGAGDYIQIGVIHVELPSGSVSSSDPSKGTSNSQGPVSVDERALAPWAIH